VQWNLRALFLVACVMGSVSCFSSLLLLYFALDSWSRSSLFHKLTLPPMPYGKVTALIYLKVRAPQPAAQAAHRGAAALQLSGCIQPSPAARRRLLAAAAGVLQLHAPRLARWRRSRCPTS
jgi:hypothetical protein